MYFCDILTLTVTFDIIMQDGFFWAGKEAFGIRYKTFGGHYPAGYNGSIFLCLTFKLSAESENPNKDI